MNALSIELSQVDVVTSDVKSLITFVSDVVKIDVSNIFKSRMIDLSSEFCLADCEVIL